MNSNFRDETTINQVNLIIGSSCNLSCRHCIENCSSFSFNEDLSDKIIAYIKHLIAIKEDKLFLSFWGGEPLLQFDLIKDIVAKFGDNLNYNFVTNGFLLTPEIVGFLNKYDFSVAVSYDGELTEKVRFDITKDASKMKLLKDIKNLSVNGVLHAYNQDLPQFFSCVRDKFGNIFISVEFLRYTWEMPFDIFSFDYDVLSDSFYRVADKAYSDILNSELSSEVNFYYQLLSNFVSNKWYRIPLCHRVVNFVPIDLQGNVYSCQNGCNKIGTVDDVRLKLLDNYVHWYDLTLSEECKTCEYLRYCRAGCPFEIKGSEGFKATCKVYQLYIKEGLALANRLNSSYEGLDVND